MFKAVLFDLDNTLIDYIAMKEISMDAALDAMIDAGLKVPKRNSKKILYELYEQYGMDYSYIFEKFLKKVLGHIDWKILASAIIAYRKVRDGFLRPYPHVEPTLLKLKEGGIKLGIVTDAPPLKAWMRLVAMGIDDFFDVVVCRTGKALKPNNLPFRKAVKALRLNPKDILMVGDNIKRDIAGGNKAGMKTCLALYGFRKGYGDGDAKADYEIKSFDKLLDIVFA